MTALLKSDKRQWEKLKRRLLRFDQRKIDVGIFRDARYGAENDNMQVAEVAYINDQGSVTNPPRPFMTVDFIGHARASFPRRAKQFYMMLLFSSNNAYMKRIEELGEEYAFDLQEIILDYPGSNSSDWAEAKGFNDPLYHTGVMVESVRHRITKRKS
jgi:hypothetical protein